jgi:RNA ligase (TIGR02306 family)
MRNLASIQEISATKQIEGADAIELVIIKGWQCVSKKGEFKTGDKCVYFEVDSFLPLEARYEFLHRTSFRNNEFMGEGLRIKTIAMRGEISQGLALPIAVFPEITEIVVGADVTALTTISVISGNVAIGNAKPCEISPRMAIVLIRKPSPINSLLR